MSVTEQYYRSFLRQPYQGNAGITGRGTKRPLKRSARHVGSSINRFGAPLSGNANNRFLNGAPTGGQAGTLTPNNDRYNLGGGRRRKRRGGYLNIYQRIRKSDFNPAMLGDGRRQRRRRVGRGFFDDFTKGFKHGFNVVGPAILDSVRKIIPL